MFILRRMSLLSILMGFIVAFVSTKASLAITIDESWEKLTYKTYVQYGFEETYPDWNKETIESIDIGVNFFKVTTTPEEEIYGLLIGNNEAALTLYNPYPCHDISSYIVTKGSILDNYIGKDIYQDNLWYIYNTFNGSSVINEDYGLSNLDKEFEVFQNYDTAYLFYGEVEGGPFPEETWLWGLSLGLDSPYLAFGLNDKGAALLHFQKFPRYFALVSFR